METAQVKAAEPATRTAGPPAWLRDPYLLATAGLVVLFLIPVWSYTFFPSQDGPNHLYNNLILHHWNDPTTVFREFYELDLTPVPNWPGTATLYALTTVFPALIAEKILISIYFIPMAAGW